MKIGKFLVRKIQSSLDGRDGMIDIVVYKAAETDEGVKIGEKFYSIVAIFDEKYECIQGDLDAVPQDIVNNFTKWGF